MPPGVAREPSPARLPQGREGQRGPGPGGAANRTPHEIKEAQQRASRTQGERQHRRSEREKKTQKRSHRGRAENRGKVKRKERSGKRSTSDEEARARRGGALVGRVRGVRGHVQRRGGRGATSNTKATRDPICRKVPHIESSFRVAPGRHKRDMLMTAGRVRQPRRTPASHA